MARWLAEEGAAIVDADVVARAVTEPGEPALAEIVRRFGEGVRRADGSLDRSALAAIVFADPAALRDLEAITHPAVRPRLLGEIAAADAAGAGVVAVEAIRLVESGLAALCDEVWLIVCEEAAQRRRLAGRGADAPDAERRIAAQRGLAARLRPAATRVVDTGGDEDDVRRRVRDALHAALEAASSAT